jgi:hypothetical protein
VPFLYHSPLSYPADRSYNSQPVPTISQPAVSQIKYLFLWWGFTDDSDKQPVNAVPVLNKSKTLPLHYLSLLCNSQIVSYSFEIYIH